MNSTSSPSSSSSLEKSSATTKALQLPEILLAIASFLQGSPSDLINASIVCKSWSHFFTASLWHSIHMPPFHNPHFINGLSRHRLDVHSLNLVGTFDQDLIFNSCSLLQELDLTLARSLNMISIKNMVQCLPRLKILKLNCCYGQSLAWLIPLMELEFLQELAFINDEPENLEDSPQYDLVSFHSIIAGNSGQVGGIIHPSDPEDDTISTEDQDVDMDYEFIPIQDIIDSDQGNGPPKPDYLGDFLVARASTLRTLSLEGSDLIGFCLFQAFKGTTVSIDSGSRSASTSSGNGSPDLPVLALRHLNLSKTTILRSGSVVEPLLRQCPDLETLDISDNFDPSWDNFQWSILHQFCLKLTSLSLKGLSSIDNSQLVQVVKKCPGLCSLIAPQSNLSSSVLDAIVDQRIAGPSVNQGGTTQQPAPFLELDVSWCTGITQDAIEKVLQHLPTLKRIRFSWCQEINLSVFQCNWSCLDLQELDAQGLDKPTTVSPEAIFTPEHYMFERISQLRSLRRLLIGSDEVNMTVADGFGLLAGIDNGSIEGLVEKAPLSKLEYLELVGSEDPLGVSELTVIADSLPRLNRFHFGLGLVTCEMQSWLSSRRPDIQQEEQQIYF